MSVQTARSATQASGVAFAVLAMACFAVMDVTNKVLVAGMPLLMALWFRYIFQAVATTVAVLPRRGWALFHTRQPGRHVLRGVLLFLCSLLAFINLQHMPVAEFTAIVMLTPLIVTLHAIAVLMHPSQIVDGRWFTLLRSQIHPIRSLFQINRNKLNFISRFQLR